MDELAHGIVLKLHPYSESSLILRWLTLEHGRLDTLACGARRPKSPFRGKLDLFYHSEFTFARSRKSDLHSLRDLRLLDPFSALRTKFAALRQASYASALLAQCLEPCLPLPEVFQLLHSFLQQLANHAPHPILIPAFELKLLTALGLKPNLDTLHLSASAHLLADACLTHDWQPLTSNPCLQSHLEELNRALHQFMLFHLGRLPTSRSTALRAPS